jgi:hypothetical protein
MPANKKATSKSARPGKMIIGKTRFSKTEWLLQFQRLISSGSVLNKNRSISPLRSSKTASFGAAVFPLHALNNADRVRAGDRALYRAIETGRNRVVVAGEIASGGPVDGSLQGEDESGIPDEKS